MSTTASLSKQFSQFWDSIYGSRFFPKTFSLEFPNTPKLKKKKKDTKYIKICQIYDLSKIIIYSCLIEKQNLNEVLEECDLTACIWGYSHS